MKNCLSSGLASKLFGLLSVLLALAFAVPASAFERGKLVIWIKNDKGFNGLAEVGKRYTADNGVEVIVQTESDWADNLGDPAARFAKHAGTVEGPDIIIWPHDRFGSWINEGLLEPVVPASKVRNEIFDFAWDAVTVGDDVFGYPLAMEAISLIYNKDLVKRPPQTFEDVIVMDKKMRKQGKRAMIWAWQIPYFTWPLITSGGGYSFKKVDRVYQLVDVGVDSPGAVRGMKMLRRLVKENVLTAQDDWGSMMDGFKNGDIAMMINGPWTWNELRDANINFGVAEIPRVSKNDEFARPFVGFLAAAINSYSPNYELAKDFLENYVVVYDGVKSIDDDRPLGAAANKKLMSELESNPNIAQTFAMAQNGETMPDIPEMARFWSSVQNMFGIIGTGEATVEPTVKSVADRLRKLDKMKMWRRRHYLAGESG